MRILHQSVLGKFIVCVTAPGLLMGEVLGLADAIKLGEANNRPVQVAAIERTKANAEVDVARTYRLPIFSITASGSQSLSGLGLTIDQGALGVYPNVGPIPGKTTTLESALRPGAILYATIAQPLSQQHKIGLGIRLARVGSEAAGEQIRAQRQSVANEIRHVYYAILELQSSKKSVETSIAYLSQLEREISLDVVQKVALRGDSLDVKAQLAQAEYTLLKLNNPLDTQKQELNRLLGRDPDTEFDVDPLAAV